MNQKEKLEHFREFMSECNVGCYIGSSHISLFDLRDQGLEFYPLGTVSISTTTLSEIDEEKFQANINQLIVEASKYGGMTLDANEKEKFIIQLCNGLENPRYYTNFNGNAWTSVTNYSRDSFICITDKIKTIAIISFDDE